MSRAFPARGKTGWVLHNLISNYWTLAVLAVIAAAPFALGILALDRAGLTEWIIAADLAPVSSSDTARDFAGVAAGINAAFITLYFSITLIVLSMAASNLGVRLIDRWLEKPLVRISIAGLSFGLIVSLVAMLAIDPESPLEAVPLALLAVVFVLQTVNIAMLTVALHDLGRTMFIDRSIASLQDDASQPPIDIRSCPYDRDSEWSVALRSDAEGYVEGLDLDAIARATRDLPGSIRVCSAPGQHVMKGDTLIAVAGAEFDGSCLKSAIPIDNFRSDGQGPVFRIRLLVEIGARALSPAVNDFYSALTCADAIMVAMRGHEPCWTEEGEVPCWADDRRIQLPGQNFQGLFEDPLAAFRQAACAYPSVSIRMIDNLRRLAEASAEEGGSPGYVAYLRCHAQHFTDHALERAELDVDAQSIQAAMDRFGDLGQKRMEAKAA